MLCEVHANDGFKLIGFIFSNQIGAGPSDQIGHRFILLVSVTVSKSNLQFSCGKSLWNSIFSTNLGEMAVQLIFYLFFFG